MELKRKTYDDTAVLTEEELMHKHLPAANGARWIELGCGQARSALQLARKLPGVDIYAYEVDEQQNAKNLALPSCPTNLTFGKAGMQDFPATDASDHGGGKDLFLAKMDINWR